MYKKKSSFFSSNRVRSVRVDYVHTIWHVPLIFIQPCRRPVFPFFFSSSTFSDWDYSLLSLKNIGWAVDFSPTPRPVPLSSTFQYIAPVVGGSGIWWHAAAGNRSYYGKLRVWATLDQTSRLCFILSCLNFVRKKN